MKSTAVFCRDAEEKPKEWVEKKTQLEETKK